MTQPTGAGVLPESQIVWKEVVDPDSGDKFSILLDASRDTFVTSPIPECLDRYYSADYHGNRHGFTARYCDWRRTRIIRDSVDRRRGSRAVSRSSEMDSRSVVRWLDIGCGDGTLLQRLSKLGWVTQGVERFPNAARSRGLVVFESLSQASSAGPYDGVSLWHVLEHLENPERDIEIIRSLLKPEGVLLIAVPDAVCLAARWFGPHWLHWDVPRHLFHFSASSLSGLLSKSGYNSRQLSLSEFEYDLMGFAQSAMNKMGLGQNKFFKLLTKRPVQLSMWGRAFQLAVGTTLCGLAAAPVWASGRLGKGGTLVFEAHPRFL